MTFKIGDRVEWTSQAAGISRTKVGVIETVVPPGCGVPELSRNPHPGACRSHESYTALRPAPSVPQPTALRGGRP